jgi:hypothetical protein
MHSELVPIDPYATHLPVLAVAAHQALRECPGLPFLEYGCGWYSTPLLSALVGPENLHIVTTDTLWAEQFRDMASIRVIPSWESWVLKGKYALAFQDSEQRTRDRATHLDTLLEHSWVVLMHDWWDGLDYSLEGKQYEIFKQLGRPWTLICRGHQQ